MESSFVVKTKTDIQRHLETLVSEKERLEDALEALGGPVEKVVSDEVTVLRAVPDTPQKKKINAQKEVLELVAKGPITRKDLNKHFKQNTSIARALRTLIDKGSITVDEAGMLRNRLEAEETKVA